jgi:hypothetical protein
LAFLVALLGIGAIEKTESGSCECSVVIVVSVAGISAAVDAMVGGGKSKSITVLWPGPKHQTSNFFIINIMAFRTEASMQAEKREEFPGW